jgi:MoaA/NifB/PqqE/SkfB family radical SAM enzyme
MLTMEPHEVLDIELELTTLCNAQCPLCYRNYKAFKDHYPANLSRDFDEVIAQIDQYPNLKWIRLVGSISEPTLYKEFLLLVEYIKSEGIHIEICTNGDTHNPEWWELLSTLMTAQDKVYFSICGLTQETHEAYRAGTRLNKIYRNAEAFRSGKKNDYAQCIRFAYNSDEFDSPAFKEMVSVFSNIYWTETFLPKPAENYVKISEIERFQPQAAKLEAYMHMDKLAKVKFESPVAGKAHCMSWEKKSQQIDIHGNVYPCYLFLEASGGKKWDGDYDKILNMEYEVCRYCDRCVVDLCKEKDLHYII